MAPETIGIVDYGCGNLASVAGAVEKLGHTPVVSADPGDLAAASRLILPGVGAFGEGMRRLTERGLERVLNHLVLEQAKPILGICLGAQLIAGCSEEFGLNQGLNWVPARVVPLAPADPSLRVPHVGWNELHQVRSSLLFEGIPADALFYYVHSFRIACEAEDAVVGTCDYGGMFTAALQWRNVYATQFHPEKSQRHGLTLLGNFLARG